MHDVAFGCSFVTDKKDRWAYFSLFRSLQINKQQNQIDFIKQAANNFYMILFQYTKRSHIFLLWNYLNFKHLLARPHGRNFLIKWCCSFKSRSAKWAKNRTFTHILAQKIWGFVWNSIKKSGLLTFQSAIRLETVFKTT